MEHRRGEMAYKAVLDKRVCPGCSAEQSYDEASLSTHYSRLFAFPLEDLFVSAERPEIFGRPIDMSTPQRHSLFATLGSKNACN